jgi:transcriptional regulator with XRE-family HTH domain
MAIDLIGKKIRDALEANEMSSTDLAKRIGLTRNTVDNIIFGRSRKPVYLTKITKILNIELEGHPLSDILKASQEVDIEKLTCSFSIVTKALKEKKVYVSKNVVNALSNLLYDFYVSHASPSQEMLEIYTMGMIDFGIQSHALSQKK